MITTKILQTELEKVFNRELTATEKYILEVSFQSGRQEQFNELAYMCSIPVEGLKVN